MSNQLNLFGGGELTPAKQINRYVSRRPLQPTQTHSHRVFSAVQYGGASVAEPDQSTNELVLSGSGWFHPGAHELAPYHKRG